jgi:hypothetical protein
MAVMAIGILAAVLGLLIATACIMIPRLVARRSNAWDDTDTQAYERETGRSAQDIAEGNAAVRARQQNDAAPQHPSRPESTGLL